MTISFQPFDNRQVMQNSQFEIFHYLDPHPGPVALHHHDFYEVYFFLNGSVDYLVEGQTCRLEPGDLLLISPLELHQPIIHPNRDPYERIVLWIDPAFLHKYSTQSCNLLRCFDVSHPGHTNLIKSTSSQQGALRHTLDLLLNESRNPSFGQDLLCHSLLLQFTVQLNRLVQEEVNESSQPSRTTLTDQVIEYIGQHYSEALSLDQLADAFFVSKYHLSHEFARVMGVSLYRYITLKRLLIAKQMLTAGHAPTRVYEACGFRDYANFYRAFKAEYGTSPSRFAGD
ncbi:AraC family transcriptional regulator [uncultured Allofournierella sp.]|uniref:AraC family transcriptional regulator n=1 Tax=uncultured Allofournierella sp. TaxID=1940258 RepID=UPI003750C482